MVEVPPTALQHYIATAVPLFISTIFIAARIYTRTLLTRNLGTDDALIFAAWLGHIAFAVLAVHFPSVRDVPLGEDLIPQEVITTLEYAFASRLIYQLCLVLSKLAIACFYLRIFQDRQSRHHIYAMMAFMVITFIPGQLAAVFICRPVQDFWSLSNRHCSPSNPAIYLNAISNIVADIWMMGFVYPRIVSLRMALRQRISLLIILSLGLVVIAASVVRLVHSIKGFTNDSATTIKYWNGFQISLSSSIEVTVSIICASAPCIRPLLLKIAPNFIQAADGSRSTTTPGSRSRPKSTIYTASTLLSQLTTRNRPSPSPNRHSGVSTTRKRNFSRSGGDSRQIAKDDLERGVDSDEGSERELYTGYELSNGTKLEGEIVKTMSFTMTDEHIPTARPEVGESGLAAKKDRVRYEHA